MDCAGEAGVAVGAGGEFLFGLGCGWGLCVKFSIVFDILYMSLTYHDGGCEGEGDDCAKSQV